MPAFHLNYGLCYLTHFLHSHICLASLCVRVCVCVDSEPAVNKLTTTSTRQENNSIKQSPWCVNTHAGWGLDQVKVLKWEQPNSKQEKNHTHLFMHILRWRKTLKNIYSNEEPGPKQKAYNFPHMGTASSVTWKTHIFHIKHSGKHPVTSVLALVSFTCSSKILCILSYPGYCLVTPCVFTFWAKTSILEIKGPSSVYIRWILRKKRTNPRSKGTAASLCGE